MLQNLSESMILNIEELPAFSILYDELTRPELGIGMKRGPIPLYVAAVLHSCW